MLLRISSFFFFNDTATTEIYTLSLHDALPILCAAKYEDVQKRNQKNLHSVLLNRGNGSTFSVTRYEDFFDFSSDRKSTRLNSSHQIISYAVFCLKKKQTSMPSLEVLHAHCHST